MQSRCCSSSASSTSCRCLTPLLLLPCAACLHAMSMHSGTALPIYALLTFLCLVEFYVHGNVAFPDEELSILKLTWVLPWGYFKHAKVDR